jgi:hypothetical protein
MSFENLSKEQQVLLTMRKILTSIIRETTPPPGMMHPLSESTIDDIRMALVLISSRERELLEENGIVNQDRPYYVDEPRGAKVLPIPKPTKKQ